MCIRDSFFSVGPHMLASKRGRAYAQAIPRDRLLLETDATYMAPVPCRGKRCDSGMIDHTAARIAQVRGITMDPVSYTHLVMRKPRD